MQPTLCRGAVFLSGVDEMVMEILVYFTILWEKLK